MYSILRSAAAIAVAAWGATTQAKPFTLEERAVSTDRLVACHFIVGIVSDRTGPGDWDADMLAAKAAGIDAFALNIGTDYFTDTQLDYAYQSAANNGMKVFISFDFNWYSVGDANAVGQKIAKYASQSSQLMMDGKPFVSTFVGDGLSIDAVKSAAGQNLYFVPNFRPGTNLNNVDGAFSWLAWPNNGQNRAPQPGGASYSVEAGDVSYTNWLGSKAYMAPISPWFSTHYGAEVSYSKNWVFPGGSLLFDRWNTVLAKGYPMVEIVTWNDYGESHYLGPLSSKHMDDGASKWVNDMPHGGWLDMSKPFIAAYKAKATSVTPYITDEKVVYWYRRHLNTLNCDSSDTAGGKPDGWNTMEDAVYVVTLLKSPATITVTSGTGAPVTQSVPAGANLIKIPAAVGQQKFALSRNGASVLSGTSLMDISNVCPCGIYNYNAYVGTLPAAGNDSLSGDAFRMFATGLHVTTCQPTPSLGTNLPLPSSSTSALSSSSAVVVATSSTSVTVTPTTILTPAPIVVTSTTSSTPAPVTRPTSSSTPASVVRPTSTTASAVVNSTTFSTPAPVVQPASSSTSIPITPTTTSAPAPAGLSSTTSSTPAPVVQSISSSATIPITPSTTSTSTAVPVVKPTSTSSTPAAQPTVCTGGTVADGESGNYTGLCNYTCYFGYCPPGPCKCTSWGTQGNTPPTQNGRGGCPQWGLSDGYKGLCQFTCSRGYCPDGACRFC